MDKNCLVCGRSFMAKRSSAKYCGGTCRKRAQRQKDSGALIGLPSAQTHFQPAAQVGSVMDATRAELEKVEREETALGAAALALAARIDSSGGDTGSAVASLVRQLRETLAAALEGAEADDDPLVQIRANALRVVAG